MGKKRIKLFVFLGSIAVPMHFSMVNLLEINARMNVILSFGKLRRAPQTTQAFRVLPNTARFPCMTNNHNEHC